MIGFKTLKNIVFKIKYKYRVNVIKKQCLKDSLYRSIDEDEIYRVEIILKEDINVYDIEDSNVFLDLNGKNLKSFLFLCAFYNKYGIEYGILFASPSIFDESFIIMPSNVLFVGIKVTEDQDIDE